MGLRAERHGVPRKITGPSERTDGRRTQVLAMRKESIDGENPWTSGDGPQLGGVQQESIDEEQDDGATGGGAGSCGAHGVLIFCTFGISAQYTGPDSTGGHFFALQFALTAAYPPLLHIVFDFSKQPPRLDCLDWR